MDAVSSSTAAASSAPHRGVNKELVGWLLIALLVAMQYFMFRQYVEREVSPFFPQYHDQTQYLSRAYNYYEAIRADGFFKATAASIDSAGANGFLYELQGGWAFLILGPSRLNALTVNFAYFAALQIALIQLVRWRTGSLALGFVGAGLLLATTTATFWAGNLTDFRIDFSAMCLYGIFVCAVIRSEVFRSWTWSLAAVACVVALYCLRYLTIVYLFGVFGLTTILVGVLWFCLRRTEFSGDFKLRMRNILLSGVAISVCVLPWIAMTWPKIDAYYINQFRTKEHEVRAHNTSTETNWRRAGYYVTVLRQEHIGSKFWGVASIATVSALAMAAFATVRRRRNSQPLPPMEWRNLLEIAFLGIALVAPFTVLSLFPSPSPVVINFVVTPVVLLVLWFSLSVLRWAGGVERRVSPWLAVPLALVIVTAGLSQHSLRLAVPSLGTLEHDNATVASDMGRFVGEYALRRGWERPRIASIAMTDFVFVPVIKVLTYEKSGQMIHPVCLFGGDIFAPPMEETKKRLEDADIIVYADRFGDREEMSYPLVQELPKIRPVALEYCRKHMEFVRSFNCFGQEYSIYARRSPQIIGQTADNWITDQGVTIRGEGAWLTPGLNIDLKGRDTFTAERKRPTPTAELLVDGKPVQKLPVTITFKDRVRYHIRVSVPHDIKSPTGEIKLTFDSFVVPAELPKIFGPTDDQRRVVIASPTYVERYR